MFTTLRAVLPGRGDEMPADVLERAVRADRDALAAYAHVTGFTLRDELPPTYPHVLAFPLHMALLAQRAVQRGRRRAHRQPDHAAPAAAVRRGALAAGRPSARCGRIGAAARSTC